LDLTGDDLCVACRNCLEPITFAAAFIEVTAKPARNERFDSSFQMVSLFYKLISACNSVFRSFHVNKMALGSNSSSVEKRRIFHRDRRIRCEDAHFLRHKLGANGIKPIKLAYDPLSARWPAHLTASTVTSLTTRRWPGWVGLGGTNIITSLAFYFLLICAMPCRLC